MISSRISFEEFTSEKSFQPPRSSGKAFPDKFKYFDGLIRLEPGSEADLPSLNFSSHAPYRHDLLEVKKVPEGHAAYNDGKGFGVYAKKLIEKGQGTKSPDPKTQKKRDDSRRDYVIDRLEMAASSLVSDESWAPIVMAHPERAKAAFISAIASLTGAAPPLSAKEKEETEELRLAV